MFSFLFFFFFYNPGQYREKWKGWGGTILSGDTILPAVKLYSLDGFGGVGEKATTWVSVQGKEKKKKRKEKDRDRHNYSEAFFLFLFHPFQKRALETLSDPAVSHTMNCRHPGV